jgi:hypothetical protein
MDAIDSIFLTLVELELRKGATLTDATNEAKFRLAEGVEHFAATLAELKELQKPAKAAAKAATK